MFKLPNPYVILGVVVAVGILVGSFLRIDGLRAHYKELSETRAERINILELQLKLITTDKNTQVQATEDNIIKITVPPSKEIINNIREAPITTDCKTPAISEEAKNAF